jgi:hypothetical protein
VFAGWKPAVRIAAILAALSQNQTIFGITIVSLKRNTEHHSIFFQCLEENFPKLGRCDYTVAYLRNGRISKHPAQITPLYRSAQPTAIGMHNLKELGIKTVINLRSFHCDRDELGETGLNYEHLTMQAWHPEYKEAVRFLETGH